MDLVLLVNKKKKESAFSALSYTNLRRYEMKVLALDLATHSTGFAVGDTKDELIQSGVIKTERKNNLIKRIDETVETILQIIKQYQIEHIIAEEVPLKDISLKTTKALFYLQGQLEKALFEYNKDKDDKILIEYVFPNKWRSEIDIHTGAGVKRNELKNADIKYVKKKYNIETNDDEADAICVLDYYFLMHTKPKNIWG